jgi:hypothetical protein
MGGVVPVLPKKKTTKEEEAAATPAPPPKPVGSTIASRTSSLARTPTEAGEEHARNAAEDSTEKAVATEKFAPWMTREYDTSLGIADEGKLAKMMREEKITDRKEGIRKYNWRKKTAAGVTASDAAKALGK